MATFDLVLVAVEERLQRAWEICFEDVEQVEVHVGDIVDVDCDALVSPANSFGFMDGGIDARYRDHFGAEIELALRKQILLAHDGELLVGTADIIQTSDVRIPFLIAAPTMRVPMHLGESVNPYLAARAVFRLLVGGTFSFGSFEGEPVGSKVRRVALPGLGTGVGGVPSLTCARQVRAAYNDIVLGRYQMPTSWAEASETHQMLYTDTPRRLQ